MYTHIDVPERTNGVSNGDADSAAGCSIAYLVGFFFAGRALIPLAAMWLFGTTPEAGSIMRLGLGFGVLALAAVDLVRPAHRRPASVLTSGPVIWVLVYLGFAAASFLWTSAASATASFIYLCGTASDVAIIILLLRSASAESVACSTMRGFILGACLVALIAWVMPAEYDLRLGDQDYFNANTIANICAFAVYFAQYLTRRTNARLTLVSFFLALTVLRSLSKGTIAAFVLSEAVFLIQDRSMSRKAKFWLTAAAVCSVLFFWALIEAYYNLYTTTGNQAETLTGRTAIWAFVLDAATEHLWIGHGFDSMWKVVPAFGTFEARHAENEILQQLYAFGVAGVVMLCGVYGSLYRTIRGVRSAAETTVFACLLLFVVVRGIVEADPFDLLLPLWCIALISGLIIQTKDQILGHARSSPPVTAEISEAMNLS